MHAVAKASFARTMGGWVGFALGLSLLLAMAPVWAQNPQRGGTLSISLEGESPGLDPLLFASFNDKQIGITVYDTLLDIDSKGKLQPNLAQKWESARDATWFKLSLRSGVKFHDETPFDAQAVVSHFKRLMDPKLRYRWAADLAPIASVEATGPLEVMFKMKAPSAHFLSVMADISGMVVSPSAVLKHGENYRDHPVGTGPFVFKEWQRGSRIVFVRNTAYWRGPVHLDGVELRNMIDEQTRIASLKAGNLDIAMNAPAKDVLEARGGKKHQVIDPGSLGTSFVMINLDTPGVSDRRVRQAMALAMDRPTLNKLVNRSLAKIANTPFGTGLEPHEQVDGYPGYDLARAKKLMAEYGKPVKLKMNVSNASLPMQSAQVIQAMWKKAGIEVELVPMEGVQLIRQASLRQFELTLYRWQGGIDPDRNVHAFFHSKGSSNRTGIKDPELDRLLDEARATLDSAERTKLYRQANNILARELPYLFLTYFNNYSLAGADIRGVTPVPDGLIRVRDVWKAR